jgi:heme exporter protein B
LEIQDRQIGNIIFMAVVELLTLPLFAVLFNLNFLGVLPQLLLVVSLATLGFAAVGTLFSAIAVNTKTREIMLPILLFPVVIPVILAAVNATATILDLQGWEKIVDWIKILAAFDVMFIALCYILFEYVVEE